MSSAVRVRFVCPILRHFNATQNYSGSAVTVQTLAHRKIIIENTIIDIEFTVIYHHMPPTTSHSAVYMQVSQCLCQV